MKQDLPETRALYRVGPVMREALLILAQTGARRSRRALARPVAREAEVGLRTALYSIAHLVEMGLVLDDPVRLSDVGRRYVGRLLRGAPERPEEWGRSRPLPASEMEPAAVGREPEREPAAVGLPDGLPRRERPKHVSTPREVDESEYLAEAARRWEQSVGIGAAVRMNEAAHPMRGRVIPSIARRAGGMSACPSCGAPLEPIPGVAAREVRQVRCPRCWSVWQGR